MSPFRYGVFQVGQIWMVADEKGPQLGFPSRDLAIGAVCVMVALHRAAFETALVTIQDEHGALRTVQNPVDYVSLTQVANHDGWDVALASTASDEPVLAFGLA
jgi:hypothetical protein